MRFPPPPPRLLSALAAVVVEALAVAVLRPFVAVRAGRAPELAEDLFEPRAVCGEEPL